LYEFENGKKLIKIESTNKIEYFIENSKLDLDDVELEEFDYHVNHIDAKNLLLKVKQKNQYYVINESGNVKLVATNANLDFEKSTFVAFEDGTGGRSVMSLVEIADTDQNSIDLLKTKWFIIDNNGNVIIPKAKELHMLSLVEARLIEDPDAIVRIVPKNKNSDIKEEIVLSYDRNKKQINLTTSKALKYKYFDFRGNEIKNVHAWIKEKFKLFSPLKLSEKEIEDLLKDKNLRDLRIGFEGGSLVILGEAGSGKTELAKRFFTLVRLGLIKDIDPNTIIINLTSSDFNAGTVWVGSFEINVKNLLQYAEEMNAIIFIDELHTFKDSYQLNDFFQHIKTAIAEKKVKIIATDTTSEYYAFLGSDEAILRRFKVIQKNAPEGEEILNILKKTIISANRELPSDEVLKRAILFSYDFSSAGAQPAKVLGLIDYMYNTMKIDGVQGPPTMKTLYKAVTEYYQIDEALLNEESKKDLLLKLKPNFDENLVGMNQLKESLIDLTYQRYAGLHDPNKPAIRVLIAGPRGTGKTEGALVYSKIMKQKVFRIEMNQFAYAEPRAFLEKVGEALKANSQATIILDELEKASIKVQDAALALLDSGKFTVQSSVHGSQHLTSITYDARNATIIATSNAGSDIVNKTFERVSNEVLKMGLPLEEESKLIYESMDKFFLSNKFEELLIKEGISAPLLDRFQKVLPAYPATRFVFKKVLEMHFDKLIAETELRTGNIIKITNKNEFIDLVLKSLYEPGVSNRFALRILQDIVRSQTAKNLINKKGKKVSFALDVTELNSNLKCKSALAKNSESHNERPRIGFKPSWY
jgi:ATP-dependent Clp protease ATP-binding subunit ClpA